MKPVPSRNRRRRPVNRCSGLPSVERRAAPLHPSVHRTHAGGPGDWTPRAVHLRRGASQRELLWTRRIGVGGSHACAAFSSRLSACSYGSWIEQASSRAVMELGTRHRAEGRSMKFVSADEARAWSARFVRPGANDAFPDYEPAGSYAARIHFEEAPAHQHYWIAQQLVLATHPLWD